MLRKTVIYLIISTVSVLALSCSKFSKIQKSQDFKFKYDKALEYYEREDYFRALSLFDQVIPFYRGTDEAENIAFKYAYAYFNQKEYTMASYYFNRFTKTYPRSSNAEESLYMSAYCKYLDSPDYELDQTNTREAINDMQLFLNTYPASSRADDCNRIIDELRDKLQTKDYEIARLYLKMDKYEAAVHSFESLLKDYPDTRYREDALFYTIQSYYYYASKSVKSKRKERYQEASDIYNNFIVTYPESKYNKQLKYMYTRATKELNRGVETN